MYESTSPKNDSKPGVALQVPIPPMLMEAVGYRGDAKYVGLYWIPGGDTVVYDTGQSSATGAAWPFQTWLQHPAVFGSLDGFNIGSSEKAPEHLILIDCALLSLSVADLHPGRQWLRDRNVAVCHDPEVIHHEQQHHAPVQVNPDTIRLSMAEEQRQVEAIRAFLDQWLISQT